jgi:putative ABC transport system permease protein
MRSWLSKTGAGVSTLLLGSMHLAAFALAPWALGRLVQTVSLPRMREHRLRTSMTILGVALGVAVLVAVVLVSRSIVAGVSASVDDLAGKADLQIRGGAAGFDEAVLDRLAAVPGIAKSAPVVQQIVSLRTQQGRRERLLMLGIDMLGNDDSYFRDYQSGELEAIRRDPIEFLNSPHNVLLSRDLARRAGIHFHDKVAIGTGTSLREFDVWGFTDDGAAVNRAFGGAVGIMYHTAMQVAFDRDRNIDHIDLALERGRDPEVVARALKNVVGEGLSVERPALRGARVSKMLATVQVALLFLSVIAMFAGGFLVFNTISISIAQRKRELGILRALGMTPRQLQHLLTLEGAVLGSVGSALGLGLGVVLSKGMLATTGQAINEVYLQHAISDVHLDARVILGGFAVGVAFATVAALLAGRRLGGLRVASVLAAASPALTPSTQRTWLTLLSSAALVAATLLLLQLPELGSVPLAAMAACLTLLLAGRTAMPSFVRLVHWMIARGPGRFLGLETRLANDNLPRNLERSSETATGLMASVALTVAIATHITGFMNSLQTWTGQIVPGDLFVTSGAKVSSLSARNTPMSGAFRAELARLPEVKYVRRLRFVDDDFQAYPIKLSSTEIRALVARSPLSLLEGEQERVVADLERGAVMVSENFAKRFGVHRGSTIALGTRSGTRHFRVAGVAVDYTSDGGTVTLDWPTFVAHWGDERVDTYELTLAPGADPDQVRRTINERWGEQHDLFVLTNAEFRGEFVKAVDGLFSIGQALELVTLLVAALGIVSAVLANVLDRIREIGVLRALGMHRRQIRRLFLAEATLLGSVGTLAGLGVGMAFGYILMRHVLGVQLGWYLPYHVPLRTMAELSLVTIPISALAGYVPARKAASLLTADALDYE